MLRMINSFQNKAAVGKTATFIGFAEVNAIENPIGGL